MDETSADLEQIEKIKKEEEDIEKMPTAKKRYAICSECDQLSKFKFCNSCGCFMPIKVKIASVSCPLAKW